MCELEKPMVCLDYHAVVNKTTLACTVAKHCNTEQYSKIPKPIAIK